MNEEDRLIIAQATTFIGGICDAYKLTGSVKETAEHYYTEPHRISEKEETHDPA